MDPRFSFRLLVLQWSDEYISYPLVTDLKDPGDITATVSFGGEESDLGRGLCKSLEFGTDLFGDVRNALFGIGHFLLLGW